MSNNNLPNKKNISPRLTFGVLLFLALGTLIYGFVSLSQNIYGPTVRFSREESVNIEQSNLISDLLELQSKDTDKDGLSDYDELYIYKTSPYLPDTDSDGYLDKQEIDGGYDPLCPKGADCRGTSVVSTGQSTSTEEQEVIPPPETGTGTEIEPLPQEVIDELSKLTPAQVRELLLSSGQMTEEQLNEIDDETLMGIYQEVLSGQ